MSQADINYSYTIWRILFTVVFIIFVILIATGKNMYIILGLLVVLSYAFYVYKGTWKYLPQ
jgi:hypothetical protein